MKLPLHLKPSHHFQHLNKHKTSSERQLYLLPSNDVWSQDVYDKLTFADGWDDDDNNNHGNYDKDAVRTEIAAYSDELNKMINYCEFKVTKGCHQHSDPHITLHLSCGHIPKSQENNLYARSTSYHIPC